MLVVALVACGPRHASVPRKTTGAVVGIARDHDTGDPVAAADIRVRAQGQLGAPAATSTTKQGTYTIDHLPPGRYDLTARFAGQPIEVANVIVAANEVTVVDLVFTLGRPDAVHADFGSPLSTIDRYHPKSLAAAVGILEGSVGDLGSKERMPGAVVTAVGPEGPHTTTAQTVTDDQGRFKLEVAPGTYVVSAYYSVEGHGQIEVRRSDIAVGGGEAVIVPLWIESTR